MPTKKMNAKKKGSDSKKKPNKKMSRTTVGALSPTGVNAKIDPNGGGPITTIST